MLKRREVHDDDGLDVKTDVEVRGKNSRRDVKGKIKRGGYFNELSTEDEKDDDRKFKEKVVNEVKENDGPKEDPVKMENRTHYRDALGNILLVMQACFVVLSTRSCGGCDEVSKALETVSSHLQGWHVLDVYKPYRARKTTVNTRSCCTNGFHYQLPNWLTSTGADMKKMLCIGRPTIEQMADLGTLTMRRLVRWTQLRLENLIGGAKAAQVGLGSGFVRFGLWAMGENRRIDDAMSKDQVAVLER